MERADASVDMAESKVRNQKMCDTTGSNNCYDHTKQAVPGNSTTYILCWDKPDKEDILGPEADERALCAAEAEVQNRRHYTDLRVWRFGFISSLSSLYRLDGHTPTRPLLSSRTLAVDILRRTKRYAVQPWVPPGISQTTTV